MPSSSMARHGMYPVGKKIAMAGVKNSTNELVLLNDTVLRGSKQASDSGYVYARKYIN